MKKLSISAEVKKPIYLWIIARSTREATSMFVVRQNTSAACFIHDWYRTVSCVLRSPLLELWSPNFICEQKWDEEGKTFNPIRQSEAKAGKWNVVEVKFEKDKFWKRQIWKRQIWRQSTTFPRLQIRQTPHNRKKSKYWRQPSLRIWGESCTGTAQNSSWQLYSAQISVYGYLDSQVEVAAFFPAAVSMLSFFANKLRTFSANVFV